MDINIGIAKVGEPIPLELGRLVEWCCLVLVYVKYTAHIYVRTYLIGS